MATYIEPHDYVIQAVKHGLKLYYSTGMKPNTNWTVTKMLKTAGQWTGGQTYKRSKRGMLQAMLDLDALHHDRDSKITAFVNKECLKRGEFIDGFGIVRRA